MKITLDLKSVKTPAEAQDFLKAALAFPDYYGKNLDALYDMLTQWDRGATLQLLLPATPAEGIREYLPRLRRVFEDAARQNPRLQVQFKG
ncbi:MAG: barstar family protein [Clostridia bacterium]|nr:barstar family protein [Clostridia bacterium]